MNKFNINRIYTNNHYYIITTATWVNGHVDGHNVQGGRKVMDSFYVETIIEQIKPF